jgi:histidyl-tRNA synthetase
MEFRIGAQARGTRIMSGGEARERRALLNALIELATNDGFEEVVLPSLEVAQIYADKAGSEILEQMYVFPDKKNRSLCLRPEGTATLQLVADKYFKKRRDVRLWYFERCWRYERPQEGRYREFFQFGVEVLNPTGTSVQDDLIRLAERMVSLKTKRYEVSASVKRGLAYYVADGFEIAAPELAAQKQVVGGGTYEQGIGFAVGFDRLMLCGRSETFPSI